MGKLERQPIWVREWIEHLRQRVVKKAFPGYRPRVKVDAPPPEKVLLLPFWVQDVIGDLEGELHG